MLNHTRLFLSSEKWHGVIISTLPFLFSMIALSGCALYKPEPSHDSDLPATQEIPGTFPITIPQITSVPERQTAETVGEYRLRVGDVVEVSLYQEDPKKSDDLLRRMMVRPD